MENEQKVLLPAFQQNNVAVVMTLNNLWAPYGGVLISSIIKYASAEKNYDVVIMHRDISEEGKRGLERLADEQDNFSVRFYDMSGYQFGGTLKETKVYPQEVYYKILAPYFLREHEKIITLDVDIILRTDIARLYDIDLEGYCIGATRDLPWEGYINMNIPMEKCEFYWDAQSYNKNLMPVKNKFDYINTGVLLIHCEKYCKALPYRTLVDTAQSKPFPYPDQDVLNLLLDGKFKFIDYRWNFILPFPSVKKAIAAGPERCRLLYEEAKQDPYIMHFAGGKKPWLYTEELYATDWWENAVHTPFVGAIVARMVDHMIHRNEYYANNKYNRIPELWSMDPLRVHSTKG